MQGKCHDTCQVPHTFLLLSKAWLLCWNQEEKEPKENRDCGICSITFPEGETHVSVYKQARGSQTLQHCDPPHPLMGHDGYWRLSPSPAIHCGPLIVSQKPLQSASSFWKQKWHTQAFEVHSEACRGLQSEVSGWEGPLKAQGSNGASETAPIWIQTRMMGGWWGGRS